VIVIDFRISSNHSSIKVSVLNRLGHVRRPDLLLFFEIGDGPGHLQDSRIGPGAHAQFVDGHFQKPLGVLVDGAMLPEPLYKLGVRGGIFCWSRNIFIEKRGVAMRLGKAYGFAAVPLEPSALFLDGLPVKKAI